MSPYRQRRSELENPNYINKILEIHKIKYSKNTKRTLFPGEFYARIYLSIDDRTGVYAMEYIRRIIDQEIDRKIEAFNHAKLIEEIGISEKIKGM